MKEAYVVESLHTPQGSFGGGEAVAAIFERV